MVVIRWIGWKCLGTRKCLKNNSPMMNKITYPWTCDSFALVSDFRSQGGKALNKSSKTTQVRAHLFPKTMVLAWLAIQHNNTLGIKLSID